MANASAYTPGSWRVCTHQTGALFAWNDVICAIYLDVVKLLM